MTRHFARLAAGFLIAVAGAVPAGAAEPPQPDYVPLPGQAGKDVVWVPSPEHSTEKMLDLAGVTPEDYVIDLGSGDGRLVIAAARRGARAHGVEYNPDLVELSRRAAALAGVGERATFAQGDMFVADFSAANVLTLFLLPANLERLRPKFLDLRPGSRIVSNTYEIGGGWDPDAHLRAEPCTAWCVLALYIVPGRAAGSWRMADGAWLTLEQSYQKLAGTLQVDDLVVPVEVGRLRGNEIRFRVNRTEYTGRIDGDHMSGTTRGVTSRPWSAVRTTE